jgi:hypothetical protein
VKRKIGLFDFIDVYPRWNEDRGIGPALEVAHLSPSLDNHIVPLYGAMPHARPVRPTLQHLRAIRRTC